MNDEQLFFKDSRLVLIAAFRYALGRMTYMSSAIVEEIVANWDKISDSDKILYIREINEAIEMGHAGMQCDIQSWKRVILMNAKRENALTEKFDYKVECKDCSMLKEDQNGSWWCDDVGKACEDITSCTF